MLQHNRIYIAGIALIFYGVDISDVLRERSFLPFTQKSEYFLCIPVVIADRLSDDVRVGPIHVYDRTRVFLSDDYKYAYIIGSHKIDRLLLSKCLSFLMCMLLTKHQGIILHASVIRYRSRAILFSGDSGCGKSTQAQLWKRYLDAGVLNHDKALIRYNDNVWQVYGSPWSGENHCYVNESAIISVIIFLEHGKKNELIELGVKQAVNLLFPQLRFFFEQAEAIDDLTNTIEQLLSDVSVYLYRCLPDKSAVMYLESNLQSKRRLFL